MGDPLPYRKFPCAECPVRKDNAGNPRSKFPASRWAVLEKTTRDERGFGPDVDQDLFGCHEGEPGTGLDLLCAGWAAAFGGASARLRLLIAFGQVPRLVLNPGQRWPELYQDWDEMVAAQTLKPGEPDDHLPPGLRDLRRQS